MLDTLAVGLPLALAAGALGGRLSGADAALAIGLLGLLVIAAVAVRRARRYDQAWLIAALDSALPRFEDSSSLLFQPQLASGSLAALQRDRLEARIAEATTVDLRPPWSRRLMLASWIFAAVVCLAAALWPEPGPAGRATKADPAARAGSTPRITGVRLRIIPPAYTGLPAREQRSLDARVPQGSRIEWLVDFSPHPETAALAFPEGGPLPLARAGRGWSGARVVDQSLLYRIEAAGLPRQRLHRLDAIADAPPTVRLVEPRTQLVMVAPGQTRWNPQFEASDDYGVAEAATLRITVTQGDGENITFKQRSIPLRGRGEARRRQFSTSLDLAREGLAPGGDMIVQLVVSDNRAPQRQQVEGPSVILRWSADLPLADGLDGLLAPTLPAYFSSQRQIIIDAEALIAERRRLAPDRFVERSNALGADQARLRLRYGQFMGEESEGGGSGGIALPTNDAPARPALPTNDDAPAARAAPEVHHDDDGHDHGPDSGGSEFGSPVDAMREFGHAHDTGDAATLFDPGTRSTLSQALDAMWGSERALRQGRPEEALPFANRALELLKEVQQASRIFLPRIGSNLPPIDLSRRLTGRRDDIVVGGLEPVARTPADMTAVEAWRALAEAPASRRPALRLDLLDRWVRANRDRLADPLALLAAIDTVRAEPGCLDCRRRLRALLWTALDRPAASVRRREVPGTRGQRYLDALR
ncbi:MAG: DUF4175 family protein [Brevundimonas sp.]